LSKEVFKHDGKCYSSNSSTGGGDSNDESSFPSEVCAENRKARREHGTERDAHAERMTEEDLDKAFADREATHSDDPED